MRLRDLESQWDLLEARGWWRVSKVHPWHIAWVYPWQPELKNPSIADHQTHQCVVHLYLQMGLLACAIQENCLDLNKTEVASIGQIE
jgi:hypothetical protein